MWKKILNLLTILTLFSILIAPVDSASAQESGPFGKKISLHPNGSVRAPSPPEYIPASSKESITSSASAEALTINLVQDPSFEASIDSQTFWGQASTNAGSPLCKPTTCGNGAGTAGPRTGNVWAWFGGIDFTQSGTTNPEEGQVWQNVTFPSCTTTLQFYFWIGAADSGSGADDVFIVGIDGNGVFSANAAQKSSYSSYTLVSIDVSAFANGGVHLLQFYTKISDQLVNMNLDDVALTGTCTISGNAGVAGANINYTDGSTSTDGNGNYAFKVPAGWSGTVTPTHPCFTFNPANRSFSSITANQTGQNYTATLNPAAGCANITVKIAGTSRGTYVLPPQGSLRVSYPGVNNGPVNLTSTNGKPLIASERVLSKNGPKITHFSELMGLPQAAVSTTYAFPAYDNVNFDSQLRFGNVSNSTATVRLFFGGQEKTSGCTANSPYTLAAGASLRVSCPGLNSRQAVKIVSNVNIVASLRVLFKNNASTPVTSFSEMMGLPQPQWNTTYWMPWYNNVGLNSQLRFGNVSNSAATVRLYIGGQEKTSGCTADNTPANSPYTIPAGASIRVSCAGVDKGPVKIVGNVPIVASLRVAHFNGTKWNDFSEMMGLPNSQVATSYLFPWYNNVGLDSQLRFANVSTSTAHVNVFIHGTKMPGSPFTLAPGASTRQSFAGIDNGPVQIVSDQPIIAAMRVIVNNGSAGLAFSELMGLPAGQLSTSYVLPYYNNVDLDTQLRFGVP